MSTIIKGRVTATTPTDFNFTGYRINSDFQQRVQLTAPAGKSSSPSDTGQPTVTYLTPAQSSAEAATDGSFALDLPESSDIGGTISISVWAPSGDMLAQQDVDPAKIPPDLQLPVTPPDRKVIKPVDTPIVGPQTKITGYVRDVQGKVEVVNQQVILWATRESMAKTSRT
jgi:hypothetical protein